jgi:hypothetical protein
MLKESKKGHQERRRERCIIRRWSSAFIKDVGALLAKVCVM